MNWIREIEMKKMTSHHPRNFEPFGQIQEIKVEWFKTKSKIESEVAEIEIKLVELEGESCSVKETAVLKKKLELLDREITKIDAHFVEQVELERKKLEFVHSTNILRSKETVNQRDSNSTIFHECLDEHSESKAIERDEVLVEAFKALRMDQVRDLPFFNGDNPFDFFIFLSEYERSTEELDISPTENLRRINKALQGKARECVSPLLYMSENLPQILKVLKLNFARKEWVMSYILNKLRNLPQVNERDLESFRNFYNQVFTTFQAAKHVGGINYISNPEIVLTLAEKLPPFSFNDWVRYKVQVVTGDEEATFEIFLTWLAKEMEVILASHNPFSSKIYCQEKSERRHINHHYTKVAKCGLCSSITHTQLADCHKFSTLSLNTRRRIAKKFAICFKCLQTGHVAKDCKLNINCSSCNGSHNIILHKEKSFNQVNDSSKFEITKTLERNNQQDQIAESSEVMLRLGKIWLHGPNTTILVTALFDEGSESTIIDENLAEELQLSGQVIPIAFQWTNEVVKRYSNSKQVNFEVSPLNHKNNRYQIEQARTINNLELSCQSIDIQKVRKLYPNVNVQLLEEINNTKPRILIGSDNAGLIVPRKTVSYHTNGLQLTHSKLGETIHGKIVPDPPPTNQMPRKLSSILMKENPP